MTSNDNGRLAVLIDADNARASIVEELLAEIAKYGIASVKRAYGDWTTTNLNGWKKHLHKHAIQPIQQFAYTTGKNSTDSSLIIDAMDLLHTGHYDGFCLVSSDSDFTRLAIRIRESGLKAYGFGENKTPDAFVSACDRFIYTEVLHHADNPVSVSDTALKKDDKKIRNIFALAITATSKDDGWADLAAVGSYIAKSHPSFDPRNHGFKKLGELVHGKDYIATKDVSDSSTGANKIYKTCI